MTTPPLDHRRVSTGSSAPDVARVPAGATPQRRHDEGFLLDAPTSSVGCGPSVSSEVVAALEAWVRRGLREYAVALRKLVYSLPNGVR